MSDSNQQDFSMNRMEALASESLKRIEELGKLPDQGAVQRYQEKINLLNYLLRSLIGCKPECFQEGGIYHFSYLALNYSEKGFETGGAISEGNIDHLNQLFKSFFHEELLRKGKVKGDRANLVDGLSFDSDTLLSEEEKAHWIKYYQFTLPHAILKQQFLSNENSRRRYAEEIKEKKGQFEVVLDGAKDQMHELEEAKSGLIFTRLSLAFKRMLLNKVKSLRWSVGVLCILGFMLVAPMLVQLYMQTGSYESHPAGEESSANAEPRKNEGSATEASHASNWPQIGDKWGDIKPSTVLPILGYELFLLYFFRIALRNYYSLKAQILQLEVRSAIIGFTQQYVTFVSKNKSKGVDASLEKFEALIFSGISGSIDNIPSTFDGISELAKLAGAIKTGKPIR